MHKLFGQWPTPLVTRRVALGAIGAIGAAVAAPGVSAAAVYPGKPIRLVVPFPASGGTDIVARILSPSLNGILKQSVFIDNRAGAATVIGTEAVATSAPDGYTLLFTSSAFTANASLMKKLTYDPLKSFTPIGAAALHPFVLVANPSLPANNVQELIAYARANPGKLSYASVGPGSSQHLGMELFKRMAGVDILHVPYSGSAPAMTDLLGGQVSLMFNGVSPTLAHIRSGKLKVLATDSDRRIPLLPDVPTVSESGLPGYKITTWSGLLAPAGVPPEVRDVLVATMQKAMAVPDVQEQLISRGLVPNYLPPAAFGQMLKEDMVEWAKLVKDANVEPE